MPLTPRDNFLRNASMTGPEWMPINVALSGAVWNALGPELEDICARHPLLFPNFERGKHEARQTNPYGFIETDEDKTDNWGCGWHFAIEGITGQVVRHPLDDWAGFDTYTPPDPETQELWQDRDWHETARRIRERREQGHPAQGQLGHGFLFMMLYYLRGFENLMLDYATDDPRLQKLIDMITDYHVAVARHYLDIGIDVLAGGDDLGTQTAAMISPSKFRQYITPAYKRIFGPAREAGAHVFLHTDGHMTELMDELIDAGVTICNPQDLCNGVEEIKRAVDGRICIRLDIDRQRIVPFGTPQEIRDHVEYAVKTLGSPRGGLELTVGIYPPTPPENIEALFSVFDECRTYWFDGRHRPS
jgi:hypothetical protein